MRTSFFIMLFIFLSFLNVFSNSTNIPFKSVKDIKHICTSYAEPQDYSKRGRCYLHNGIDFQAEAGTKVIPVENGWLFQIANYNPNGGYDYYIFEEENSCLSNYCWIYGHLDPPGEEFRKFVNRHESDHYTEYISANQSYPFLKLDDIQMDHLHLTLARPYKCGVHQYLGEGTVISVVGTPQWQALDNPLRFLVGLQPDIIKPIISTDKIKFYQNERWNSKIEDESSDGYKLVSDKIDFSAPIIDRYRSNSLWSTIKKGYIEPLGIFALGYEILDEDAIITLQGAKLDSARWTLPKKEGSIFDLLCISANPNKDWITYKVSNCTGGKICSQNLYVYWNTKQHENREWYEEPADSIDEAKFPDGIYTVRIIAKDAEGNTEDVQVRVDNFDPKVACNQICPGNPLKFDVTEALDPSTVSPWAVSLIENGRTITPLFYDAVFDDSDTTIAIYYDFNVDSSYEVLLHETMKDFAGKEIYGELFWGWSPLQVEDFAPNEGKGIPAGEAPDNDSFYVYLNKPVDTDNLENKVTLKKTETGEEVDINVEYLEDDTALLIYPVDSLESAGGLGVEYSLNFGGVTSICDGDSLDDSTEWVFIKTTDLHLYIVQTYADAEVDFEDRRIGSWECDSGAWVGDPPPMVTGFCNSMQWPWAGAEPLIRVDVEYYHLGGEIIATPGLQVRCYMVKTWWHPNECQLDSFNYSYDSVAGRGSWELYITREDMGCIRWGKIVAEDTINGLSDETGLFYPDNYNADVKRNTMGFESVLIHHICPGCHDSGRIEQVERDIVGAQDIGEDRIEISFGFSVTRKDFEHLQNYELDSICGIPADTADTINFDIATGNRSGTFTYHPPTTYPCTRNGGYPCRAEFDIIPSGYTGGGWCTPPECVIGSKFQDSDDDGAIDDLDEAAYYFPGLGTLNDFEPRIKLRRTDLSLDDLAYLDYRASGPTCSMNNPVEGPWDISDEVLDTLFNYAKRVAEQPDTIPTNKLMKLRADLRLKAYPNPHRTRVNIELYLPEGGVTRMEVIDMLGRKVGEICNKELDAGSHLFSWSCAECKAGMYHVIATTRYGQTSYKLILSR